MALTGAVLAATAAFSSAPAAGAAKWTVQLTSASGFDQNGACYVDTPDTVSSPAATVAGLQETFWL